MFQLDDFVAEILVISVEVHSHGEHDVHLLRSRLHGKGTVGHLHGLESL